MSLIDYLCDANKWQEYFEYKKDRQHLSKRDLETLRRYIETREYMPIVEKITDGTYIWSYPIKKTINKSGTKKKRVVYTYTENETQILKFLAFLLYRYDDSISRHCYSFRRSLTAKDAISDILKISNLGEFYSVKADISNYFNSMPTDKMLDELNNVIGNDARLYEVLSEILSQNIAIIQTESGEATVAEQRGAMAGVPVSAFLANIYLKSLDDLFENMNVPYFRYSDDILIFAESKEKAAEYLELLTSHVNSKGLAINESKTVITPPHSEWEFLGFAYKNGKIDLSLVTIGKMKAKIKRKARALYRWRTRKNVSYEKTAQKMIKIFNKKFFDEEGENSFTWSRWFFPVLSSSDGLAELDRYLVMYLRYLSSGRHYKGNYSVKYETLKSLGLQSLVNEYYKSNGPR